MTKGMILFDLGGTLVKYYHRTEFPPILRQAITEVQDCLRKEGSLNASPKSVWQIVEEENHEAEDHLVRPLEERLTRIFQLDDAGASNELVATMCRHFMKPIFALAHCYEDALPVLRELGEKGYKRAIVSNTPWGSPANLWREELRRFGLDEHVDATVFCRDAGWRKPARQIFEFALKKLKAKPRDCVFVGDDPRWDLVGPRAVGIEAILIDRKRMMQGTGEETISDLYELPGRL